MTPSISPGSWSVMLSRVPAAEACSRLPEMMSLVVTWIAVAKFCDRDAKSVSYRSSYPAAGMTKNFTHDHYVIRGGMDFQPTKYIYPLYTQLENLLPVWQILLSNINIKPAHCNDLSKLVLHFIIIQITLMHENGGILNLVLSGA